MKVRTFKTTEPSDSNLNPHNASVTKEEPFDPGTICEQQRLSSPALSLKLPHEKPATKKNVQFQDPALFRPYEPPKTPPSRMALIIKPSPLT